MQMFLYFNGHSASDMKKINDLLANGWFCADLFCFPQSEVGDPCGFILLERDEDYDEDLDD